MPRFGYLPRGEKAADRPHRRRPRRPAHTPEYFNRLEVLRPGRLLRRRLGVRARDVVHLPRHARSTDAQMQRLPGRRASRSGCTSAPAATTTRPRRSSRRSAASSARSRAAWPSLHAPVSNRTHCIVWSDWAGTPKAERRHGIRFDTNYYYKGPDAWVAANGPGLMTGSGFPQRFADLDGSMIDVYQATTQVTDEMDGVIRTTDQMHALLDNALGPKGYYGVFTAILHSDNGDHERLTDLVSEARDRGVPVVSSAQMLDWLDGRNGSSFDGIAFSGGQLQFTLRKSPKARGLEAMVPVRSGTGPLSQLTRGGAPGLVGEAHDQGRRVRRLRRRGRRLHGPLRDRHHGAGDHLGGRDGRQRGQRDGQVEHGRAVDVARRVRADHDARRRGVGDRAVLEAHASSSAASRRTRPTASASPRSTRRATARPARPRRPPRRSRRRPARSIDSRTTEFSAGTGSSTYAGAQRRRHRRRGAAPARRRQRVRRRRPAARLVVAELVHRRHASSTSGGALVADGARAVHRRRSSTAPQTLEFTAKFEPVNNQGVGFSNDFSDYPMAAFTTGSGGDAVRAVRRDRRDSGPSARRPAAARRRPLRAAPLPDRVAADARSRYYVDGALVGDAHRRRSTAPMRPVVSDYGLHGASVKVHWLRMGSYATTRHVHLARARQRPGRERLEHADRDGDQADRHGDHVPDALRRDVRPGRELVRVAERRHRRRHRQPELALHPVPRDADAANATRHPDAPARRRSASPPAPTARRCPGTVALAPAAPTTNQTLTATPSGFSDPDGDPLTYRYRWYRNGTRISGAAASTLNLSVAGNGDRGDQIRVEVYATDGRGAASDAVKAKVTVANTAPTAGTVTIKPTHAVDQRRAHAPCRPASPTSTATR